jgi:NAD-dependent SIR2 family protein deacetylase
MEVPKMAKKKTENEESEFIRKLKKLDHEYRVIQAHIDLLKEQLAIKESEINAFLAENMQPK